MDTIHVVADYGQPGDLAWAELSAALSAPILGCQMIPVVVPRFNTIAAGFVAAQLARRLNRPGNGILINVDPRTDHTRPVADGAGAPFVCAVLKNDLLVFSPNAGHSLSSLKAHIRACYLLHEGGANGQFRSRDLFPGLMALVVRKGLTKSKWFDGFNQFDLAKIPDLPAQVVGYVDGYGNVKTTMTLSHAIAAGWEPYAEMLVCINGSAMEIVSCARSIMGVAPGQFVLAPGSSGDPENPYMEFAVRSTGPDCTQSGARILGYPKPGAHFSLQPFRAGRRVPFTILIRRALRRIIRNS